VKVSKQGSGNGLSRKCHGNELKFGEGRISNIFYQKKATTGIALLPLSTLLAHFLQIYSILLSVNS